jgi:glucose-1-phosphate cytidylyltransferase
MKVVILAGGLGTRLSEETIHKPKPMVEINGQPILWHLMNSFLAQGINEFIIATGYKASLIETWVEKIRNLNNWTVSTLFTGENTLTAGRIKTCMDLLKGERILVTYGDGLANVNFSELLKFHESSGGYATLTAVRPPARFGHLEIINEKVVHFGEKNQADAGWINGGYFILEPEVSEYLESCSEAFETGPLPKLALDNKLNAYKHYGFWQPMDTLREKIMLETLADLETPPWLTGFI